jgi:hypothetical protein
MLEVGMALRRRTDRAVPTADEVQGLVAEAVRLGRDEGASRRAVAATGAAVAAARRRTAASDDPADVRLLGRAVDRQAALDALQGLVEPALRHRLEALDLACRALDGVGADHADHDAMVAEAASSAADAARLAGASGRTDEQRRLLGRADELSRRGDGPLARRARGNVAYARASQVVGGLVAEAQRQRAMPARADLVGAVEVTSTAVRLRRDTVADDDDTTRVGLAEALSLHGRALALAGDVPAAVGALEEAVATLDRLSGPSAAVLADQARAELASVRRLAT